MDTGIHGRVAYPIPSYPINAEHPPETEILPADPRIGIALDAGAVSEYRQYLATLAVLQGTMTDLLSVLHLHRQVAFELTRRGASTAKIAEYTADARGWIDQISELMSHRPQETRRRLAHA